MALKPFETLWSMAAASEIEKAFPREVLRPRHPAPTAPGTMMRTDAEFIGIPAAANFQSNLGDQRIGSPRRTERQPLSPRAWNQSRQPKKPQEEQTEASSSFSSSFSSASDDAISPSTLSHQPPRKPAWSDTLDPPRQLVVPAVGWLPNQITQKSEYILVHCQDLMPMCFPDYRDQTRPEPFWLHLKQIDVHISTTKSRPLNWRQPPQIRDKKLLADFFGKNEAVSLPLRNAALVDRVWEALDGSSDPEAALLKNDLERAVAAVQGPSGCRRFPYPGDVEDFWHDLRQRFTVTYVYEQYLRHPPGVDFAHLWEPDPALGGIRPNKQLEWVQRYATSMPRLREVLFFTRTGTPFETPAFHFNVV